MLFRLLKPTDTIIFIALLIAVCLLKSARRESKEKSIFYFSCAVKPIELVTRHVTFKSPRFNSFICELQLHGENLFYLPAAPPR